MNKARSSAVAGLFYENDPNQLIREIKGYLDQGLLANTNRTPKALIAPHAGYIYSGPIAGSAYATLEPIRHQIKRVVLMGPAHRVYIDGIAASSAESFATPLGKVMLDQTLIKNLVEEFDFLIYSDEAHAMEHSLEVQLPFLQQTLDEFVLLPFAVGGADPTQVETLLNTLWGGDETLVVISSDLSHYRSYVVAQEIDSFTSEQIHRLLPDQITSEHACGQIPIRGLLNEAKKREMQCDILDVRNSGDTAGPKDRVVGYGAYAFYSA